jgi:hypothetical protein
VLFSRFGRVAFSSELPPASPLSRSKLLPFAQTNYFKPPLFAAIPGIALASYLQE